MASASAIIPSPEDMQMWDDGTRSYDVGEYVNAICKFMRVTPNSKMLYNIGCCYLSLGSIDLALEQFADAVEMDPHMAVGYFMLGLIYCLKDELDTSYEQFGKASDALRGNKHIDYSQLGLLNYRLYACEIISNQASIKFRKNKFDEGKDLLAQASRCKVEKRHDVISDSLNQLQNNTTAFMSLFMPPNHVIFRPSSKVINQLKKKDYLGESMVTPCRVISRRRSSGGFACFSDLAALKKIMSFEGEGSISEMDRRKRTPPERALPPLNIVSEDDTRTMSLRNCLCTSLSVPGTRTKSSINIFDEGLHEWLSQKNPNKTALKQQLIIDAHHNSSLQDEYQLRSIPSQADLVLDEMYDVTDEDSALSSDSFQIFERCETPSSCCSSGFYEDFRHEEEIEETSHEVMIHYNFTRKIRLKEGATLSDVRNIVEAAAVPDVLHLCTTKDEGSQQLLTQRTLTERLKNSSLKEIHCSNKIRKRTSSRDKLVFLAHL